MLGWFKSTGLGNRIGNGQGTYNLNGGLVTGMAGGFTSSGAISGLEVLGIAGTGVFNQTGGTNNATFALCVGGFLGTSSGDGIQLPDNASTHNTSAGVGIYNLSGGLLQAAGPTGYGGEYIGLSQHGTVNQTNGTNIATSLTLGANATYNFNGGLLQTNLIQGASGFNFNAGTLQAGPNGLAILHPSQSARTSTAW